MKARPKSEAKAGPAKPKPLRGKRTWREKLLDDKDLPKIIPMPARGKALSTNHTGTMAIPSPREVDELMRRVPRGKLTTIDELRAALAAKHQTTVTCPITTGIFAWIAAHAADEGSAAGATDITPYWRTLKARGELNPKYPGGLSFLTSRLEEEGHTVSQKGSRCFVQDYGQKLARLR